MSRLFITGDTHQSIDISKLNSSHFPFGKELTKDDILIIAGDAGFVWNYGYKAQGEEKYWRDWLTNKPWTTFCVLGNHENYDVIEELPIVEFCGAPAYKVSDSIYYAISGNVYTLCGKKCLVVNGADSQDIYNSDGSLYRKPHISWWEQEKITQDDINKALISAAKCNDKVDFILTHTGGSEVCKMLGFTPTPSDMMLDQVLYTVDRDKHICGHYHLDRYCGDTRIVFNDIIMLASDD